MTAAPQSPRATLGPAEWAFLFATVVLWAALLTAGFTESPSVGPSLTTTTLPNGAVRYQP